MDISYSKFCKDMTHIVGLVGKCFIWGEDYLFNGCINMYVVFKDFGRCDIGGE